ncbi:TIGR02678 family protein [Nonomuraea jiangxiensis]|uniref:TIGR02678 family protein n=1 Tax=Nonomuraea jiangxiensis TaxID=633440 RepID=A0A1G8W0B8_9ACTN|nr:TIGR02678 family protein [Nonomuraea jiangxiensis]SDJ71567.1 TIGR02678 family protein [Nonomuraea jiangxiensis]
MSTLANQLVRAEKEEIARAIRTLLGQPLVSLHDDPAVFDLIRKRRQPLTQWFDYFCGWRLVVEPRQGYARLVKIRSEPVATRPARRRRSTRAPFDRRRYTLLCLCAAELLTSPVTTIGMLAQRVVQAAAVEAGVPGFDPVRADERAAFVDALKLLEHYGAVTAMDGATDSYLADEDAKVLYRVDTTRVIRLLAAPVPPSRIAATTEPGASADAVDLVDPASPGLLAALTVEARYGGDEPTETQRNLWARHSLIRRLLDEPVVYRDELTPAQAAYAASLTGRQIIRRAAEEAGFVLEERAEGLLLIDAEATATDTKFPDDGSHAKVAALLLLDLLVSAGPVTAARLDAEAAELLRRFPQWAKAYQSDGGGPRLAADALEVLALFGLARRTGDQVAALPAAARYRVERGTAVEEDA